MKIRIIFAIFLMLSSKILLAQWTDNFDNLYLHPDWQGDTSLFYVNKAHQLQSRGVNSGSTISISRSLNRGLNTIWEFKMGFQFKLATNNFSRVYLLSNQSNLKAALQGYFVEISGTGTSFKYTLKKQNGIRTVTLITSENISTPSAICTNMRVSLSQSGRWFLYVYRSDTSVYQKIGEAADTDYISEVSYFGVYCKFNTSARSSRFYFDDFRIYPMLRDTVPPVLNRLEVLPPRSLRLTFSENINPVLLRKLSNYSLNEGVGPSSVQILSNQSVRLDFPDTLKTANYQLRIDSLIDWSGNSNPSSLVFSFFHIEPHEVKYGDLVVNELMPKPDTLGYLPKAEYVELYNRSDKYVMLKGWKWADKQRSVVLPSDTIAPGQYAILCPQAFVSQFRSYGKTIGLPVFPSLNNDTDVLYLHDANGRLIDSVAYSDTWYDNEVARKKGGISLERINIGTCTPSLSWTASRATLGGTPAVENSVYMLRKPSIQIRSFQLLSDTAFRIVLNQRIDMSRLRLSLEAAIVVPDFAFSYPDSTFIITATLPFPIKRGQKLNLKLYDLDNCQQLVAVMDFPIFRAFEPNRNEILISEIMVYPNKGNASYIELYNASNQIFNLKDLSIANKNTEGLPSGARVLSRIDRWFAPHDYLVMSSDTLNIQQHYYVPYPERMCQMPSLPQFSSEKGTVWLLNSLSQTVDSLTYTKQMHLSTFRDLHGVSLERVSFQKDTFAADNFVSASANVGFGTPTYTNAAQGQISVGNRLWLSSKTVSPNADGFEDVLEINFELNSHDWMAEMKIYDAKGNMVTTIYPYQSLSPKGCWRYLFENFSRSWPQGVYVLVVQLYNTKAQKEIIKLPFALLR